MKLLPLVVLDSENEPLSMLSVELKKLAIDKHVDDAKGTYG